MDEQMQQQIVALVQAAMQGDEQASQQIQQIMQAAQQGDQQAAQIAQMIQAVAQQMQGQQAQMARFGAKLNYIKHLRGECPSGMEMQYFKKGGRICKQCVNKNSNGGDLPKKQNPVEDFKNNRDKQNPNDNKRTPKPMLQKCGGKTKKKKACGGVKLRMQEGGLIPGINMIGPSQVMPNLQNFPQRNRLPNKIDPKLNEQLKNGKFVPYDPDFQNNLSDEEMEMFSPGDVEGLMNYRKQRMKNMFEQAKPYLKK